MLLFWHLNTVCLDGAVSLSANLIFNCYSRLTLVVDKVGPTVIVLLIMRALLNARFLCICTVKNGLASVFGFGFVIKGPSARLNVVQIDKVGLDDS